MNSSGNSELSRPQPTDIIMKRNSTQLNSTVKSELSLMQGFGFI